MEVMQMNPDEIQEVEQNGGTGKGGENPTSGLGEENGGNVSADTPADSNTASENSSAEIEEADAEIAQLKEEIKALRGQLNTLFKNEKNTTNPRTEYEEYIYSDDSMTSKIMKSYGIKED